jgi:hypothetical protein
MMTTTTMKMTIKAPTSARMRATTTTTNKTANVLRVSTRSTRSFRTTTRAAGDEDPVPFGYTRKDVMLIGGGLTGAGYGAYYGLQALGGMDATRAGNAVQLTFVLGLTLAWVGSYVMRVFNKDMTYVKQLKDYEDAVMQKRLEEMPASELEKMMSDLDEK